MLTCSEIKKSEYYKFRNTIYKSGNKSIKSINGITAQQQAISYL